MTNQCGAKAARRKASQGETSCYGCLATPTPYAIDIGVIGLFNVLPTLDKNKREGLLTANGASILYGAIREMVTSMTSRFAPGPLTLPGMNFEDHDPSRTKTVKSDEKAALAESKEAKAIRKGSKKSSA